MSIIRTENKNLLNHKDATDIHGCWYVEVFGVSFVQKYLCTALSLSLSLFVCVFLWFFLLWRSVLVLSGIAIYLSQEVVNNALLDLNPNGDDTSSSVNQMDPSEALLQPCHKRRKHGPTGSLEQKYYRNSLEVEVPKSHAATLMSVKIAALETLEALLTMVRLQHSCSLEAGFLLFIFKGKEQK